ncbi:hypothetical protein JB92DRAFT_2930508 [Gautieria morchelliformis]|nr:hypothetical protein JB92DRAFT_2930508 [Gautieria morchelliformis]
MKIDERWREVAMLVQEKRFCQNQEADTLKNKVSSMLTWVEGGKFRTVTIGESAGERPSHPFRTVWKTGRCSALEDPDQGYTRGTERAH